MTWVVTIDSRFEEGRTVFFMKQPNPKNQWWTVVLDKAAIFTDVAHAHALVKKLKYNNPRVRTLDSAQELVAKWFNTSYTATGKKKNNDRQISPQRRQHIPVDNRVRPSVRQNRTRQYDLFEPEYDHELNHLVGLDGWGSEGR